MGDIYLTGYDGVEADFDKSSFYLLKLLEYDYKTEETLKSLNIIVNNLRNDDKIKASVYLQNLIEETNKNKKKNPDLYFEKIYN